MLRGKLSALALVATCVPAACSFLTDTDDLTGSPLDASASDVPLADTTPSDDGGATSEAATSSDAPADVFDAADGTPALRCGNDGGAITLGTISAQRGTTATLQYRRAGYDLQPTVMVDGAGYVMWLEHEGTIARVESSSPDGPWHSHDSQTPDTFTTVLTGAFGDFDHYAGAPSVIRVGGIYYMYYVATSDAVSRTLALATSTDGILWSRRASPILTPTTNSGSMAGPSAFYAKGRYYLLFGDTSAPGSLVNTSGDPEGQFLIRSSDPTFQSGIEQLTTTGWMLGDGRKNALFASLSGDIAYVPELDRAVGLFADRVVLFDVEAWLFTSTTNAVLRALDHGIFRRPDGTVFLAADCVTLPIDFARALAEGEAGSATDQSHFGFDLRVR